MDKETWQYLVDKLRDYQATSTDRLKILVKPRTLGSRPDLVLPLYFDPQFFELVGETLRRPTRFNSSTGFTMESRRREEIGRTAIYYAIGLLGANSIETPANHLDKLVVTVLVPHSEASKKQGGIPADVDGLVLSYHLDATQETAKEKLKKLNRIAKDHRRRN